MTQQKKPNATGALNTLRHSLSAEKWHNALQSAKEQQAQAACAQDQRTTDQPRHQAVRRCLLRIDRGQSAPGIYIVRSSDISDGGARIIHGGPIKPDTVCCVIIETTTGQTLAAGGTIAWCNPVKNTDPSAYELGIRFYKPIDASPFADHDENAEEAA